VSILKLFFVGIFISLLVLIVGDYFVFDLRIVLGVNMIAGVDSLFGRFFFVGIFVTSSIILFSF